MAKKTKDKGIYINPLTDFGFKRLFGDKELMIDFLNGVLNIEDGINDLYYGNTVRTGISKEDRAIIFDLYCTTGADEKIIVEMQALDHDNYKERTIYYASRVIQEQAKRGKDWDYALCPVYVVNIVNFEIDKEIEERDFLSRIQLMYTDIHRTYYDKLTILYLELPRFSKKENELETNTDRWMYSLKYLPVLERLPSALRGEVFEKLFELARISKLSKKQQNAYYKSLHDMGIVKFRISNLENTIAALQTNNATLQTNNAALQTNNVTLQTNNAALQEQVAAYQRKYGTLEGTKDL